MQPIKLAIKSEQHIQNGRLGQCNEQGAASMYTVCSEVARLLDTFFESSYVKHLIIDFGNFASTFQQFSALCILLSVIITPSLD